MLSKSTRMSALNCTVLKLSSGASHKTTQLTSLATRLRLALLLPSLLLSTQMVTVFSGVFKSTLRHSFQQVSLQWYSSVLNGSLITPLLPPMALTLTTFATGLKNRMILGLGPSTTTTLTYSVEHGQARTLTPKLMPNGTCSTLSWKWNSTTISGTQISLGNKFTPMPATQQASWALAAWVTDFFKTQTSTSRHLSMATVSLSKLVTRSSRTKTMLLSNPLDSHKPTILVSITTSLIPLLTHKLLQAFHRLTPPMLSLHSDHLLNKVRASKTGRAQSQLTSPSLQWTTQQTLVWLLLSPLLRHQIRLMLSFGMFRWTATDNSLLALVLNFSSLHFGLTRPPPQTSPSVTSPQSKTRLLHQHSLTSSVKCILMA